MLWIKIFICIFLYTLFVLLVAQILGFNDRKYK
jgi:hypothetical protein